MTLEKGNIKDNRETERALQRWNDFKGIKLFKVNETLLKVRLCNF